MGGSDGSPNLALVISQIWSAGLIQSRGLICSAPTDTGEFIWSSSWRPQRRTAGLDATARRRPQWGQLCLWALPAVTDYLLGLKLSWVLFLIHFTDLSLSVPQQFISCHGSFWLFKHAQNNGAAHFLQSWSHKSTFPRHEPAQTQTRSKPLIE